MAPMRAGAHRIPTHEVPTRSPWATLEPRQRLEDQAVAKALDVKLSVKKLNLVAKLVRRMHIDDAIIQLALVKKKAAQELTRVLLSARGNAKHLQGNPLDTSQLVVDEILILRAKFHNKRVIFRAKGTPARLRAGRSHIYVRVRQVVGAKMKTVVLKPWWERRDKHRNNYSSRIRAEQSIAAHQA